jgi:broad specificity phosphatase PhoE
MVDFIKKADQKHKKENILVVSHGEPLLVLESFIRKEKIINNDFTKRNYIQAGEWRELVSG